MSIHVTFNKLMPIIIQ